MWTRAELKRRAKGVLSGNYWQAFVISLVIAITGGSHNQGSGSGFRFGGEFAEVTGMFYSIIGLIFIGIVIRILIGYVLEVGGRKYFIELSQGNSNMSYLGYGFKGGRFFDIVITMLLRSIYIFLWTLLLIIPGIIKSYAYRMVPYILADNPNIGYNRAIELSNEMTSGEKLEIFILDLSFLGWYLLGALALGIGVLFVQPYFDATHGELYHKLREKALQKGLTTAEELRL